MKTYILTLIISLGLIGSSLSYAGQDSLPSYRFAITNSQNVFETVRDRDVLEIGGVMFITKKQHIESVLFGEDGLAHEFTIVDGE